MDPRRAPAHAARTLAELVRCYLVDARRALPEPRLERLADLLAPAGVARLACASRARPTALELARRLAPPRAVGGAAVGEPGSLAAPTELPAAGSPPAAVEALGRWLAAAPVGGGTALAVLAGEAAAACAWLLGLDPTAAPLRLPDGALCALDWPLARDAGDDAAGLRPALAGVDLDWLPPSSFGGSRGRFPSGPSGAGTAARG